MNSNLKVNYCGIELNSPIVLLSGCVGFGEEYTRIDGFSNSDVGAVCLKGQPMSLGLEISLIEYTRLQMEW